MKITCKRHQVKCRLCHFAIIIQKIVYERDESLIEPKPG